MSRADRDSAMTEQDAVAADELKRFCQQLVRAGQFRSRRRFTAGSSVETEYSELSMHVFSVNMDNEDVDYMLYSIDRYAFPLTQRVPVEYIGEVLRVYTHGVHPGYARLINERSEEDCRTLHTSYELDHYTEIRGPAQQYQRLADFKENLEQDNDMVVGKALVAIVDNVPAVHCPYWPVEAYE